MLDYETVNKTIGKGFADKLDEQIFYVNDKFQYSRRDMVEKLGCANFIAAAKLSKILRKLRIESPTQLMKTDPFSIVRTKGIGESCIFVAMCILDASDYDVEAWWGWSPESNVVKFSTFKTHAMQRSRKYKQAVA